MADSSILGLELLRNVVQVSQQFLAVAVMALLAALFAKEI